MDYCLHCFLRRSDVDCSYSNWTAATWLARPTAVDKMSRSRTESVDITGSGWHVYLTQPVTDIGSVGRLTYIVLVLNQSITDIDHTYRELAG